MPRFCRVGSSASRAGGGADWIAEVMESFREKRFFGLAFRAARPLVPGRLSTGGQCFGDAQPSQLSLPELAEGPYFILAMMLDADTLCRSDATCRLLRQLNRANAGPWRALGGRMFHGMELEHEGIFESAEEMVTPAQSGRKHARLDWKGRYVKFTKEVPTFRLPFKGGQIKTIRTPDDVAYCKCRLRSDLLCADSQRGVYLEVEVVSNPDNLSLAVVDFESGGRSSVTFSPDTGAVIREKKLRESPRKVQGAYIQPLEPTRSGRKFEGVIGVYIFSGQLAFFRRCVQSSVEEEDSSAETPAKESGEAGELGPWECTGFITDLFWAEGKLLTPCLAFRNEGPYKVRVSQLCPDPPYVPARSKAAFDGTSWLALNWEADSSAD